MAGRGLITISMMIPMRCWAALAVLVGIGWGLAPGATYAQRPDSLARQPDSLVVEPDSPGLQRDSLDLEPDSLTLEQDTIGVDSLLAQIRTAYQQLDYEQAEERARVALSRYDELSSEQLVEVHTILAVVNYAANETEEARRHFEAALMFDPELGLNPDQFSPKIVAFFNEVKGDMQPPPEPQPVEPEIRYVTVVDPIPAAAIRSIVLPGWGQLYKGQRTKGRVLIGAWGVTATSLLVSQAIYSHYVGQENEADTPRDARDAYDRKNTWFKIRNNVALVAGGIWLYGYLDTILSDAQPTIQINERATATLRPGVSSLRLDIRF